MVTCTTSTVTMLTSTAPAVKTVVTLVPLAPVRTAPAPLAVTKQGTNADSQNATPRVAFCYDEGGLAPVGGLGRDNNDKVTIWSEGTQLPGTKDVIDLETNSLKVFLDLFSRPTTCRLMTCHKTTA